MNQSHFPLSQERDLRRRAAATLGISASGSESQSTAAAALRVLHDLAIAPATAADSLAVLHELQVHQVELELQFEEICTIRNELEFNLATQSQRYEAAPAALCAIDRGGVLLELNRACARLLGRSSSQLTGVKLLDLLSTDSRGVLSALMEAVATSRDPRSCAVDLVVAGASIAVTASVAPDPVGSGFLVAFGGASQG